ncbi:MAG: phage tail tip lysozyme, partial [Polyangiaceae bacterium]
MNLVAARRVSLLALALSVTISAFGCSGNGTATDGETAQSEEALDANELPAFQYFVSKGLTTFQAAGIVGNLVQESNVSPTSVQSGGPGRGIAQWSVGGRWDHDAGDNAVAFAAMTSRSVLSLAVQLDFIWYELTNHGYGYSALKATTNVTDATVVFMQDFEGCGTCVVTSRITYAKAALAAYGAIPYGASFVSQSFPLATTTLKMKAGEVIPSFIELKNTGTKTWSPNT